MDKETLITRREALKVELTEALERAEQRRADMTEAIVSNSGRVESILSERRDAESTADAIESALASIARQLSDHALDDSIGSRVAVAHAIIDETAKYRRATLEFDVALKAAADAWERLTASSSIGRQLVREVDRNVGTEDPRIASGLERLFPSGQRLGLAIARAIACYSPALLKALGLRVVGGQIGHRGEPGAFVKHIPDDTFDPESIGDRIRDEAKRLRSGRGNGEVTSISDHLAVLDAQAAARLDSERASAVEAQRRRKLDPRAPAGACSEVRILHPGQY